jgi:hypothetical protein
MKVLLVLLVLLLGLIGLVVVRELPSIRRYKKISSI